MNTGTIATRYAKALYRYASEQGAETAVYHNMLQLKDVLRRQKGLPVLLKDPSLSFTDKVRSICDKVQASPLFENFITLVLKAQRGELLLYMAYSYIDLYRKEKRVVNFKITTAVPLPPETEKRIAEIIAKKGDFTPEFNNVVDPSIIGGFVCVAGNTRLDASVSTQLSEIRKQLVKETRNLV
jgi:F-type H+-transporting ATPase subunit delta